MKKLSFSVFGAVLFSLVISVLTVNCNTGLGEAVDTQPPKIAITYPPENAAIRDEFVLAGTCSDDKGVASVSIRVVKDGVDVYTAKGVVDASGTTWSARLNTGTPNANPNPPLVPEKTYPIKDGSCTIYVSATDTSGRVSGTAASRSFEIDNTAPVLILNKPLAVGSETPSGYGRVFKLAGDTNDDHNITLSLYLKQVDGEGSAALGTITGGTATLTTEISMENLNVSSMSSDAPLIIAQYYDNPQTEEQTTLRDNYVKIYGTPSANGTNVDKYYYAGIRVMDKAKVYVNPNETEAENTSTGNQTDTYFINTKDLYKELSSIGTDGVKAGDLKKIFNGTDTSYTKDYDKITTALNKTGNNILCRGTDDIDTSKSNVLSLNPDNSPTWSVSGYAMGYANNPRADEISGFADYAVGSTMNLTLTPNRDLTTIDPSTISMWLEKYKYDGGKYVKDTSKEPLYIYDATGKKDDPLSGSPSSDPISVTITKLNDKFGISAGEFYKILLEGLDFDDNGFAGSNGVDGYGFKVASTDTPPTVRVAADSPIKDQQIFKLANLSSGITIKVNIYEQSKKLRGTNPVVCTVNSSTGAPAVTPTVEWVSGTNETDTNFVYTVKLKAASVPALNDENYIYNVLIEAFNTVEKDPPEPGFVNLEITGDNAAPVIEIRKPAKDEIVKESSIENDKYTLSGIWKDENGSGTNNLCWSTNGTTWNKIDENDLTQAPGQSAWSVSIPVVESENNTFYVKGTDAVGNERAPVSVTGVKFDFKVPELFPGNYDKITNTNPYTLSGTARDSFRLNATPVSFVVNYKANESAPFAAANASDYVATPGTPAAVSGGGQETNWSVQFKKDGIWQVKATAKDWVDRESTVWTSDEITVDSTKPVIKAGTTLEDETWAADVWFKNPTPTIKGKYTEELSGIDKIYYWINAGAADNPNVVANDLTKTSGSLSFSKNSSGEWEFSGGISATRGIGLKSGSSNTLSFAAVDKAGNVSDTTGPMTVKLDISSPEIDSNLAEALTNGGADGASGTTVVLNIGGKVKDDASTITKLELSLGDSTVLDTNKAKVTLNLDSTKGNNEGTWSAEIYKAAFEGFTTGEKKLYGTVYDGAGNSTKISVCTVKIDKTHPESKISEPSAGKTVNKKFLVSGTASDNEALKSVKLQYRKYTSGSWGAWTDFTGGFKKSGTAYELKKDYYIWDSGAADGVVFTDNPRNWGVYIDSEKAFGSIADGTKVQIRAVAADSAGNSNIDSNTPAGKLASVEFTVDQNSDRPVINITNMNPNNKYVGTAQLKIKVTDDDDESGNIASVTVTSDSGTIAYDEPNGQWILTPTNTSDGDKVVKFNVTDVEGGVFTYSETGDEHKRPYIQYNGKTSTGGYGKDDLNYAVNYTVDTESPKVDIGQAKYASSEGGLDSATAENLVNTLYLGGTRNRYVQFIFKASDTSGIEKIEAEVKKDSAKIVTFTSTTNPSSLVNGAPDSSNGNKITGTWTTFKIDMKGTYDGNSFDSGLYEVEVTATDKAGETGSTTFKFNIDKTAPTVNVTVNEKPSDKIITSATINATITDGSGAGVNAEHKWAISKTKPDDTFTSWQNVNNANEHEIQLSWEDVSKYSNDTYATKNAEGLLEVPLWFKVVDKIGNFDTVGTTLLIDKEASYPTVEINNPEDGKKVGIMTKIGGIASLSGNASTGAVGTPSIKEVRVQIDADGDGDYDGDDYTKLKGTEGSKLYNWSKNRIKGTASDWYILADVEDGGNWSLSSVPTGEFGDETHMNIKYRVKALGQMDKHRDSSGALEDGNLEMKDYNASGVAGSDHIRKWTDTAGVDEQYVVIDPGVPQIKDIFLVEYNDESDFKKGTKRSRAYTKNMYIGPGNWYITANLEDETALDNYSLSVLKTTTASASGFNIEGGSEENISSASDVTEKSIKPVKITTSGMTSGRIDLEFNVFDSSSKSNQETITIYIDSDKPTIPSPLLYNTQSKAIGANVAIENSDGWFTIGNQESDSANRLNDTGGSQISYIAFWFERQPQSTGVKRVFNPMLASTKTGDKTYSNQTTLTDKTEANASANELFINDDGLAVMKITGLTVSGNTITLPSSLDGAIKQNIRRGGLVKTGGSYVMISNISGNTLTLNEPVEGAEEAYFAFAQVVNNRGKEEGETGRSDYDGFNPETTSSDGDGMQECFNNNNSWWANINSANIPDGPIIVHITVIDGAGNLEKTQVSTSIANNRPRITRVMVASDWDNSDTFDLRKSKTGLGVDEIMNITIAEQATPSGTEFGEFVYYSAIAPKASINPDDSKSYVVGQSDVTLKADNGKVFVVPNKLCIIPQFTGGNIGSGESIKYTYDVLTSSASTDTLKIAEWEKYATTKTGTATALDKGDSLKLAGTDAGKLTSDIDEKYLSDTQYEKSSYHGGIVLDNDTLRAKQGSEIKPTKCLAFTFWDATDETTQGTDSLYALLKIPVVLNVNDLQPPTAEIDPFHWKNKTDNSVYFDGSIQGHIELEADLSDALKSSKYTDGAPKVSGKIVLRGSVEDDIQLSKIAISMEDLNSNTVAEVLSYNKATQKWTSSAATGIVSASAENEHADQTGHKATYEIVIDTEQIAGVAGLNKKIRVFAKDWNGNYSQSKEVTDGSTTYTTYDEAFTASQTTTATKTALYTVDVVPYITGVSTALDSLNSKNPSVYSRTARGHYSIREGEPVTFTGHNLGTKTSMKPYLSGRKNVEVNGVASINNINNNDAHGKYTYSGTIGDTGNKEIYDNFYNRQPNGVNNNLLTDDIEFDAWHFNSNAARPVNGKIEQPHMKINPVTDVIGFAYVDGPLYFSMARGVRFTDANGTKDTSFTPTSYDKWCASYDFFTSVGFTYDAFGRSWGCAAGGDINDHEADHFDLFSSQFGQAEHTHSKGSYDGGNIVRLESIGQRKNGVTDYNKQRIMSPSFATTTTGDATTNLYLAYYDAMNDEIRFRAGSKADGGSGSFGNFQDEITDRGIYDYTKANVQIVTDGTKSAKPGEYVSIAATSDNKVVMVWYDQTNRCLWYSYANDPFNNAHNPPNGDASNWFAPKKVFSGKEGEYCQIAIDAQNHVHIAAYDPVNCDLVYAYADSYTGESFTTSIVDSYGIVGGNITLDVAVDASNKALVHIGYFSTSTVRPKYARNVEAGVMTNGSVSDEYTGVWECSTIPVSMTQPPTMQSNQYNMINVAVWKNANGTLKASPRTAIVKADGSDPEPGQTIGSHGTVASGATGYHTTSWGWAMGNGTTNAVLGYAIKLNATTDRIETAQMVKIQNYD